MRYKACELLFKEGFGCVSKEEMAYDLLVSNRLCIELVPNLLLNGNDG